MEELQTSIYLCFQQNLKTTIAKYVSTTHVRATNISFDSVGSFILSAFWVLNFEGHSHKSSNHVVAIHGIYTENLTLLAILLIFLGF